jgi:hypothetical protein
MQIEVLRQPIIILGMHRSGTTMVTELLDRLGLFVGTALQGDHEATYFLSLNDTLLRRINGAWDNPAPIAPLLRNAEAAEMTAKCLRGDVLSTKIRHFLGLGTYFKYRSIERFDRPWGWKDPRTVFTLPLWLKLFPQAKIINILRNGIDVAASLQARELKMLAERVKNFDVRFGRTSTRTKLELAGYRGSARCLELAGGFSLWEEYVTAAERNLANLPNEQTAVRFEDFLADPTQHLAEWATFCGLSATPEQLAAAVPAVNPSRGNAWEKDTVLRAFADTVCDNPLMAKYGYGRSLST